MNGNGKGALQLLAKGGAIKPAAGGLAKLAGLDAAVKTARQENPTVFKARSLVEDAQKLAAQTRETTERVTTDFAIARIDFIFDRTASRYKVRKKWMQSQEEVFQSAAKSAQVALRLVHFGGDGIVDSGYLQSAEEAKKHMAAHECVCGSTEYLPSLDLVLNKRSGAPLRGLVLIGDCFEENIDPFLRMADVCAERNILTFCLCDTLSEGHNADLPFEQFASRSGGVALALGSDVDFSRVISAATVYIVSGEEGLKKQPELLAHAQTFLAKLRADGPRRALGSSQQALPGSPHQ